MSERKLLNINLDLFKIPDKTRKKNPKKPKNEMPKIKMNIGRNNVKSIRQKVMKLIRQRQQDDYTKIFSEKNDRASQPIIQSDAVDKIKSQLAESVDFLSSLAKKESVPLNKTLKNSVFDSPPFDSPPFDSPPVSLELPNVFDEISTIGMPLIVPTQIKLPVYAPIQEPPHGCMKYGGKKPTFRNWVTQKNLDMPMSMPINASSSAVITIPTKPPSNIEEWRKKHRGGAANQDSLRSEIHLKKEKYKLKTADEKKQNHKLRQYKRRKIFKRTYKIGRHKTRPQIGVLVSNRTIRNNITTQCQLLKQTPIQDVKKALIKKGLIKIGTLAPNEVLRKMYETVSMVCGEVQNHNSENMLYNYIHGA